MSQVTCHLSPVTCCFIIPLFSFGAMKVTGEFCDADVGGLVTDRVLKGLLKKPKN